MKRLLILSIAVLLAFSVNAQRYGARLGGNFAGIMTTVETEGTKIAPGMQIGILTELGTKMFALRVEANFAQKGFNIKLEEDAAGVITESKSKVNFEYIEIPVLAKVKFFGPLYAYAGPYFGIAFKGNVKSEYTVDGVKQDLGEFEDVNLYEENSIYKKTDFGVAMGLGAQFGLGPIHAFAEGRATLGLSNLYDTESDAWKALVEAEEYKNDDHLKNMVFTVAVGILLGK
ncbi:MAG: PorT family protein [Bacteroidales bacterium]|nr:PorT family protein [Bacteroidales bacterium]